MTELSQAKSVVRSLYSRLDETPADRAVKVLSDHMTGNCRWRGVHPFNEQDGPEAVANSFWKPLKEAFSAYQRREDIFLAGKNFIDDARSTWVMSMGHILGLFDKHWLGIPPTRRIAFLPYVEFYKVEQDKIVEAASYWDVPKLMHQAGVSPVAGETGAVFMHPGPRTHDGLLYGDQDPEESTKTLNLINTMLKDLHGSAVHSPPDELRRTWHEDMFWFGPAGIGASFTIERYERQHQQPFSRGLTNRRSEGHDCRMAEGHFGGFFGYPSLTMEATGGFMGMAGSKITSEMRLVDVYRRQGDLLAENWIFIDLLHFLNKQGLDVLERMVEIHPAAGG